MVVDLTAYGVPYLGMTKQEAMEKLGVARPIDLARCLGLTKQAINSWSDPLSKHQIDRVHAELWRRSQAKPARKAKPAAEAA